MKKIIIVFLALSLSFGFGSLFHNNSEAEAAGFNAAIIQENIELFPPVKCERVKLPPQSGEEDPNEPDIALY